MLSAGTRIRGDDRAARESRTRFSSVLSFAEVHRALAKRFLRLSPRGETPERSRRALESARDAFHLDWMFSVNVVEMTTQTLSNLPDLVERFDVLRASDAVHLASALWLRDKGRWSAAPGEVDQNVEFIVADRNLGKVARACGLAVFDPEEG